MHFPSCPPILVRIYRCRCSQMLHLPAHYRSFYRCQLERQPGNQLEVRLGEQPVVVRFYSRPGRWTNFLHSRIPRCHILRCDNHPGRWNYFLRSRRPGCRIPPGNHPAIWSPAPPRYVTPTLRSSAPRLKLVSSDSVVASGALT
jgi:hypothetical protein